MRKVLKVTPDLQVEELDLDAPSGSLAVLQGAVEGWVECVAFEEDFELWCNEEGKITGLPVNPAATRVWSEFFPGHPNTIEGAVVFTGGVNEEGESLPISESRMAQVIRAVEAAKLILRVLG
jgi:hypothetical protein